MSPVTTRARHVALGALLAAAVYALAACLAYWPIGPLDAHHVVGCACSDPVQEVWFLNWTSFALVHGLNPFFTNYMLAPRGADLGANTSMPLLGLIGTPITLTLGPVATYNLLLRVAFAASALSMFLVLRRYTTRQLAAFGGGLLFAFSPYMVVHGQRHLFLIFLPLLPPLIPLIDAWLVRPRRSPLISGLLIGLVEGLEYLISPEVVLATFLMVLVALVTLAVLHRDVVRARLPALVSGGAVAVALFALLAGYPIWMLLHGAQHPHGPPHPVVDLDAFREDVLSVVVPTPAQAVSSSSLLRASHIPILVSENGLYLGVPLIALLVYVTIRCRKNQLVVVAAVVGVVAAILSLGTWLQVAGHEVFPVMPFRIVADIPILQNLEPARLTLFVQFAAAVIFAIGLDAVHRAGWTPTAARAANSLAVAAVGAVALIPLVPGFPYLSPQVQAPAFFTSKAVDVIPADAVALTFPFDYPPYNDAMIWQVASGMRFYIVGGDAFAPLPSGQTAFQTLPPGPKVAQEVLLENGKRPFPPIDDATAAALRTTCRLAHADVVLVDLAAPDAVKVLKVLRKAFGVGPRRAGGVVFWINVQADLHRH